METGEGTATGMMQKCTQTPPAEFSSQSHLGFAMAPWKHVAEEFAKLLNAQQSLGRHLEPMAANRSNLAATMEADGPASIESSDTNGSLNEQEEDEEEEAIQEESEETEDDDQSEESEEQSSNSDSDCSQNHGGTNWTNKSWHQLSAQEKDMAMNRIGWTQHEWDKELLERMDAS